MTTYADRVSRAIENKEERESVRQNLDKLENMMRTLHNMKKEFEGIEAELGIDEGRGGNAFDACMSACSQLEDIITERPNE